MAHIRRNWKSGTIHLCAGASLLCLAAAPAAQDAAAAWWDDRQGGWIGGIGGSVLGLLGGLIGLLVHLKAPRRLTFGLIYGMILFGCFTLLAGLVALFRSQPYAVYYPLLLLGFISALVPGVSLPGIHKQYREHELRRMQALDAA